MNIKTISTAIILSLAALISCNKLYKLEGNFDPDTQGRIVGSFDKVKLSSGFSVTIIKDTAYFLEINAESNLMPYIETKNVSGTLHISEKEHVNIVNHYPVNIYVHTPYICEIKNSGSGSIECGEFETDDIELHISGSGDIHSEINAENVEADISGSGEIELTGNASKSNFHISGSGSIEAIDLTTDNCEVNISGSGKVYITVNNYLDVKISGSGNVFYIGDPVIHTDISGSGEVIKY